MTTLDVAYIVSTLGRTGPTRQLYNLINNRDATCIRVSLITLSPEPPDSLKADFQLLGIKIYSLGLGRIAGVRAIGSSGGV